jgi:hypothetical protein
VNQEGRERNHRGGEARGNSLLQCAPIPRRLKPIRFQGSGGRGGGRGQGWAAAVEAKRARGLRQTHVARSMGPAGGSGDARGLGCLHACLQFFREWHGAVEPGSSLPASASVRTRPSGLFIRHRNPRRKRNPPPKK